MSGRRVRDTRCSLCRFFQPTEHTMQTGAGQCRRYPPVALETERLAVWPEAFANDACGEFDPVARNPEWKAVPVEEAA